MALREALLNALRRVQLPPGQSLRYTDLRERLLLPLTDDPVLRLQIQGIAWDLTRLDLQATAIDGRSQTATLADPQDIHVRSVEQILALTPPTADQIAVTILTRS